MKNICFFIVIFCLFGCKSNKLAKLDLDDVDCPNLLFSSEHKVYIDTDANVIDIDNINYQATINNAKFLESCFIRDDILTANISILFVVNPLSEKSKSLSLPYYVALLDDNRELKEIQYFLATGNFKREIETKKLIETEITNNSLLTFDSYDDSSVVVIGFILDDERLKILN